ncbi:hypothetical protein [Pedobacter deserti]|uniref:hypothetical protein n=1 Tax=Pedobacter deserti TaxID=2817382 RepID=UPI002108B084|nr:hypothetical protein [Pedobacter sp. SYSU D00382]
MIERSFQRAFEFWFIADLIMADIRFSGNGVFGTLPLWAKQKPGHPGELELFSKSNPV